MKVLIITYDIIYTIFFEEYPNPQVRINKMVNEHVLISSSDLTYCISID